MELTLVWAQEQVPPSFTFASHLPLLAPAPPRTVPASNGCHNRNCHVRIPWDGGDTQQHFYKLLASCSPLPRRECDMPAKAQTWSSFLLKYQNLEKAGEGRVVQMLWAQGLVTSVSLCSVSLLRWPYAAGASRDKKVWPKPKDRQVYLQALAWDLTRPLRRSGQGQRVREASTRPVEPGTGIPTKAPATDDPVWGA